MSLSFELVVSLWEQPKGGIISISGNRAYSHFLLGDDDSTVLPPHTDGGDVRRGDSLESIFW
jgi:hypothetical protein